MRNRPTTEGEAFDELCPKVDQGFVWRMVSECKADGIHDQTWQCRHVVARLYDGLAFGNWPSAVAAMGKYEAQP